MQCIYIFACLHLTIILADMAHVTPENGWVSLWCYTAPQWIGWKLFSAHFLKSKNGWMDGLHMHFCFVF